MDWVQEQVRNTVEPTLNDSGLSCQQIAERMGVAGPTLYGYAGGKKRPISFLRGVQLMQASGDFRLLRKACEILGHRCEPIGHQEDLVGSLVSAMATRTHLWRVIQLALADGHVSEEERVEILGLMDVADRESAEMRSVLRDASEFGRRVGGLG